AEASHAQVVLWNVATQQRIAAFPDTLFPVAFSPDGRTLATRSGDETGVVLWDVATQQRVRRVRIDYPPTVISFSPDGKTLVAGAGNQAILVDLASGESTTLQGHVSWVTCASFSP